MTRPSAEDVDDLGRLSTLVLDAAGIVQSLARRWNLPHLALAHPHVCLPPFLVDFSTSKHDAKEDA